MRYPALVLVSGALFVVGLGSCGDGDGNGGLGGASCGTFSPCGGGVVGTWELKTVCFSGTLPLPIPIPGCTGATGSIQNASISGTVTYNADLTTTASTVLQSTMKVDVPQSCLPGQTCAQLEAQLKAEMAEPDSGYTAVSCSGSGACTCLLTMKPDGIAEPGTYRIAGNQLITRAATGEEDTVDYCASATELKARTVMSVETGTLSMTVVATKR
jgi:hypothetical protein